MPSEFIQQQIETLLAQAAAALAESDWVGVHKVSLSVLAVDPGNDDANSLLAMAEPHLGDGEKAAASEPASSVSSPTEIDTPTSFANGRYEVTGFLGEGGKKKVYLVHDTTLDRDVAFGLVKAEGLDDASRQRITREAQAMARLGDNPNIMPIFDLGEENGQPYMVGPLMGGGDVAALIEDAEDGRLPLEDALRIAGEICSGLEFAHSKSIIHRDLKPGNVWLTDDGTARIGDFGLALSVDRSRLTQEKMMVGTVSYMPPEQATGGEITPKADLYSLGAMLYEMVTGRPPFMGDDEIAIIGQHINTAPVAPQWHRPDIPAQLDSLVMRLLSKNPAERPESAGDVLSALDAIDATPREVPAETDGAESGSLDSMAGGVFVGRHREMDQLKAVLENALSGRGSMVTLVGEPGIGKSRIALELETYAGLRNAAVLWGRCYEGTGAPPYWPWVQAIRGYVSSLEPEELRSQMGSTASVISEVVEEVKQRLPDTQPPPHLDDPESARFRLFDSIATFLKNAGQAKPIVLVLDDLHWSDKPSLMLLEFVARELASSRVMIVGTYRDMELNRRHPLTVTLGDLSRAHLFERVLLRGLTREDVGRFIEIAAGVTPPRGLIDAVHTQSEGNPLFVTETVRLLIQEGELQSDKLGDRESWTVRIPEGVREVIGRRLDKLSERCNEILTTASVIGRQFSLDQMKALSEDVTEDRLVDVLDEALAAQVIDELPDRLGWYEFSHALIQETLAEELSATRTVRMHARIAEALESLYEDAADEHAEELVVHFVEAETVLGTEKIAHYSRLAGDRAAASHGYEDAVSHYERTIAAIGDQEMDETQAELWVGLGRSQGAVLGSVDLPIALASLEKAVDYYVSIGDADRAADAAEHEFVTSPGILASGAPMIERALAIATPGTAAEAKLLTAYGMTFGRELGRMEDAIPALDKAELWAQQAGDTALMARISTARAACSAAGGNWDEGIEYARNGIRYADDAGHMNLLMETLFFAGLGSIAMWKPDDAELYSSRLFDLAERRNLRRQIVDAISVKAMKAMLSGEFDAVIDHMNSAIEWYPLSDRWGIFEAKVRYETGEPDTAARVLQKYADLAVSRLGFTVERASGMIRLLKLPQNEITEEGYVPPTPGEVAALAEQLRESSPLRLTTGKALRPLRTALATIAHGDAGAASSILPDLREMESFIVPALMINVVRVRANTALIAGEIEEAETEFKQSLELSRAAGYRVEQAWTCYDYSKLLLERDEPGDRDKATELQDEAIAIATELGMKPLLERVLAQREILKA